jgi:hypothetical protein
MDFGVAETFRRAMGILGRKFVTAFRIEQERKELSVKELRHFLSSTVR